MMSTRDHTANHTANRLVSGETTLHHFIFVYGVTLEGFPKIDISVHLTNISGVGKSDSYGLGHPGGLITRKPVVQIYSPLSVFINCDPVCIWLKGYTVYLVMSLRWPC